MVMIVKVHAALFYDLHKYIYIYIYNYIYIYIYIQLEEETNKQKDQKKLHFISESVSRSDTLLVYLTLTIASLNRYDHND